MKKLVFLRYLFSLAIVEACRDEAVLGSYGDVVKIKWTNDIYTVLGEGEHRELKKNWRSAGEHWNNQQVFPDSYR